MTEKDALTVFQPGGLEVPDAYKEAFEAESGDNLAGVQVTLPKIQMPTGRGKEFLFNWPNEQPKEVKEAKGIILYMTPAKAYWVQKFGQGIDASIPDCASHDGIKPSSQYPNIQNDVCATCQHNKFGSKSNDAGGKGRGKACRDVRRVVFMDLDRIQLPALLNVPPGSLKAFDEYMVVLRMKKRPYWSVVTEMSLETATSKDNIVYPQVRLKAVGGINKSEDIEVIKHHRNQWVEILKHTMFRTEDVEPLAETNGFPPAQNQGETQPASNGPQEF